MRFNTIKTRAPAHTLFAIGTRADENKVQTLGFNLLNILIVAIN